jgi:hypothetical protein
MRKTIDSKYRVVTSLAKLCEYMYRKGVKDSSEVFDEATIRHFLDDNDPSKDLRFILDEDARKMKVEFYAALMGAKCYAVKAQMAGMLFDYGASKKPLVAGACFLVNAFYRRGLEEGIGVDLGDARIFMQEHPMNVFIRIDGSVLNIRAMLSEMLTEALRLESMGLPSGYRIWKFLNDAIVLNGKRSTFIYDDDN